MAMWNGRKKMKMSRHKDDFYPTPLEATQALLRVETFSPVIWEPAAGDGAVCRVLEADGYGVMASDLNDYGYCETGKDFLMAMERECDSLVTNPPYRLAEQFILHAINLGVKKHAWLLRLSFLEGAKRHERLFRNNPPARVHVFSKRLTLWRGDEQATGSGTTAYAWFVWTQDYSGRLAVPQLGWI